MSARGGTLVVAGIAGSLNPRSRTCAVVRLALEGAVEAGAAADFVELGGLNLPFCTGEGSDRPGVEELRGRVGRAGGLVLGTPEYHGSFSGVLKNALDLLRSEDLEGKVVGLVGVSGGRLGAAAAMAGLREVARAVRAWVVPLQAGVPNSGGAFDPEGRLRDGALDARVRDVGRRVTAAALALGGPPKA